MELPSAHLDRPVPEQIVTKITMTIIQRVLCILFATVTVLAYAVNGNEFLNESLPDQECEPVSTEQALSKASPYLSGLAVFLLGGNLALHHHHGLIACL
jgi:hypothetical protein